MVCTPGVLCPFSNLERFLLDEGYCLTPQVPCNFTTSDQFLPCHSEPALQSLIGLLLDGVQPIHGFPRIPSPDLSRF